MSTEYDFFTWKQIWKTYVSKRIEHKDLDWNITNIRYVSRVLDSEEIWWEIKEKWKVILRVTSSEREEIVAKVLEKNNWVYVLTIQRYTKETWMPHKIYFSFVWNEIKILKDFIDSICLLNFDWEQKKKVSNEDLNHIKKLFWDSNKKQIIELVSKNNLLPDDILSWIEYNKRKKSLEDFEEMLKWNLLEGKWQKWFENKDNSWILWTNFVEILDDRRIDVENIADFLMKSYDGFLDIVEIKRPEWWLNFWSTTQDHWNLIPHQDLIKAITQSLNYLYEIERESNSQKFSERVWWVKVVKPRITLIFWRSNTWWENEKRAYRILNSSYHNLSIITFDHVLERAKMILKNEEKNNGIDDIPF